jgi:hypothetical protein
VPTVDALMDVYWVQPTGMSTATTVLNNDIGSPLHVSEVNGNYADVGQQITLPSGALLTLFTNGTFQYTPIYSASTDYFTYKTTDGVDSDTATVNIYVVNPTPTQLYATYIAAVEDADADYASAVATEIATRDAAIAAARASAQDDADDLYDVYLAAFETAEATYLAAVADAEEAYNDDVADADAIWATANDAAMAVYDAAIADAQADYDAALAALESDYDDAIADADADFYTAIGSTNAAAWDAAVAALADAEDALADAEAALTDAITTGLATKAAAYATALTAYNTALADAEDTYDAAVDDANDTYDSAMASAASTYASTIAPYQSARDAAYTYWQNNLSDPVAEAAYYDAEDDLTAAIANATDARDLAEYAAELAHYTALFDASTTYTGAQSTALMDQMDAEYAADMAYLASLEYYENAVAGAEMDVGTAEYLLGLEATNISTELAARDAAYAAALTAHDAGVAEAEEDLIVAQVAAVADYETTMAEPNEDWTDANDTAYSVYAAAVAAAYETCSDDQSAATTAFEAAIATLQANLASSAADFQADFETEVAAALAIWTAAEEAAWDDYETDMANVPGSPALDDRKLAPPIHAPTISSLDFNTTTPKTYDVLRVDVVGAADADGDQISFRYVWYVNAVEVRDVTSLNTWDLLDLSETGYGDKGDNITVSVTPSDAELTGETASSSTITLSNSAPVAVDTNISLEAYYQVYSGIDFLVNAADLDGDTLTIDIVNGPTYGSLTFNSSTGLYEYNATTSYLGRDSFSVRYYDGTEYSAAVSVDILVYDDTTNFATDAYVEGFAGLAGAAFNGAPSGMGLRQGNLNDCWFLAAASGLAEARPAALAWNGTSGLIQENANGSFTVRFPGYAPVNNLVFNPGPIPNGLPVPLAGDFRFSTNPNNGDWPAILEQAWATRFIVANGSLASGVWPALMLANLGGGGIRYLTGHGYTYNLLAVTPNATTIANLNAALNPANPADKKVVTALSVVGGGGLSPNHVYTVLAYNAATQTVTVRNPWGENNAQVAYNNAALQRALALNPAVRGVPLAIARSQGGPDIRGAATMVNGVHAAEFTMPLNEFVTLFASVNYENAT